MAVPHPSRGLQGTVVCVVQVKGEPFQEQLLCERLRFECSTDMPPMV